MKNFLKRAALLFLVFNSLISIAQNVKHYDGNVQINAKTHILKADFTISFNSLPQGETMKFFLHRSSKNLQLKSGNKEIATTITDEEFIEKDHAITFDTSKIKNLKLKVRYTLNLDSLSNNGFRYHKNWIELNLYTAWYPINTSYGRFPYTVNTTIDKGYGLFGSGVVTHKRKKWKIDQTIPSIDISTIYHKGLKEETIGKIKFYHYNINREAVATIKNNTEKHYNYINNWLGATTSTELFLAVSNLKHTTSYARKNFISLSVAKKYSEPYDKILAHELGHLWWNKASVTNWEEWLNESFAEYTAIIAQRNLFGEENFVKNINRLKKRTKKLASPYQLEKGTKNYQNSVTYKGAYYLYELENKVGRVVFANFLQRTHQEKIKFTSDLMALLEKIAGKEAATFLLQKLRKN
jgi:hypothetical protein